MQKMILLIDDDREEWLILEQAFQLAGLPYSCAWASSMERAYQLLQEIMPDYIFIDYNMPRMNGIECLVQVKAIPGLQKIPVSIYSSQINEDISSQAKAKGAVGCIPKTTSLSSLINYLHQTLGEDKIQLAQ